VDDEIRRRRARCTDSFHGNGLARPADLLSSIPPETVEDVYGDGGAVTELESYVAGLLGKPAAVYLPSGTMAQAAVLRMHADRRTTRTIVWHHHCHVAVHENAAYQRLHDLVGRAAGDRDRLITTADLTAVAEPVAALLLELPQRDLGGQLPAWEELERQTGWARERGAAAHLDGARLWEASAGYGRPPDEIAGLFDTVYVSFYKGIGALSGCCVAGSEQDVAEVREWRHRLGGTLFGLWPGAASALSRLPLALAELPARMEHARAIAGALSEIPAVRVLPDPPHTPMMHLLLNTTAEAYAARAKQLADETQFWVWPSAMPTGDPDVVRFELAVGSATMRHKPSFIAETLEWLSQT
jgi:threonine aldolase